MRSSHTNDRMSFNYYDTAYKASRHSFLKSSEWLLSSIDWTCVTSPKRIWVELNQTYAFVLEDKNSISDKFYLSHHETGMPNT